MLRLIADRLSYANVVATLALFVALGGVSYAVTVPKRSVGTAQLKNNAVKSSKVKNNALKSRDIRNNTLTHRDVRNGTLRGRDIRNGSLTGADLRDGSLAGADVADGSLSGTDVADGSLTGTDIADGSLRVADIGDLPAITPTLWAAVDGSGTGALRRASGFSGVVRIGTGQYRLAPTSADLAGCAWLATPGDTTTDGSWSSQPPMLAVTTFFEEQVRVEIYNADGTRRDADFSVAAVC